MYRWTVPIIRPAGVYSTGWDFCGPSLPTHRACWRLGRWLSIQPEAPSTPRFRRLPRTLRRSPQSFPVVDADNLAVRERLNLAENLSGRAVLNAAADTIYAVSESGVTILDVGALSKSPRVSADREDLVFRGTFCQHGAVTQSFRVIDPGGGHTSFVLASDLAGVNISPVAGRTPATIQVTIDPGSFRDRRGTVSALLKLTSPDAVNQPAPVRLLVTNQRPDERGSTTDVPGTLADLLADPDRDRFYVLRQDRNQVLVFEGSGSPRSRLCARATRLPAWR